jgi:hypothetical protein
LSQGLAWPRPPLEACEVCVVVPARDEGETVEATVAALANQRTLDGQRLDSRRFEVLLLANNCRDATARLARRAAARFPGFQLHVLEVEFQRAHAHIGTARRLIMDTAARRLLDFLSRPDGVIATTDADTVVAHDWVAQTLAEIRGTADRAPVEALGGCIRPCRRGLSALGPVAHALQRRDALYWQLATAYVHALDPDPHDPWPRHYHHFGGSLAVTARAYRAVGGLPALRALEDIAFFESLVRHDIPFRHSLRVKVTTSARCHGRTPAGLSTTLQRWTESASQSESHRVEAPAALAARGRQRRQLREFWSSVRSANPSASNENLTRTLAARLGTTPAALLASAAGTAHFGAWIETVVAPPATETVEVEAAIAGLRTRLTALRREASLEDVSATPEPAAA